MVAVADNYPLLTRQDQRIPFAVFCPHCWQNLRDERITEVSYVAQRTFFYTESDHQLAYSGVNLESVHCLSTLDSQALAEAA